ncbi:MAG TPA: hypothetical protein VM509_01045 [Planctomycetota bacterium]|nr:hypothetical protein [Planctomycetota bacterium]
MHRTRLTALALACATLPAAAQGPLTRRVSVATNGAQANGPSAGAALARGGEFVAFLSTASNLVAGDTNRAQDLFVRDLFFDVTARESVSSSGAQADAESSSTRVSISANGRFVAFCSRSASLVPGDTNDQDDVFLRDRSTGTTIRVSVSSAGQQGDRASGDPSVSDDGRFVAFISEATNFVAHDASSAADVFLRDRLAGTTTLVGVSELGVQASLGSFAPFISGDGRFVAFTTASPELLPAGASGSQVFVHSPALGATHLESVSTAGDVGNGDSLAPMLSTDGRWLVFRSLASNLAEGDTLGLQDGFLRDRVTHSTYLMTYGYGATEPNGATYIRSVSDDARYFEIGGTATNMLPFDDNGPAQDCWVTDLAGFDNIQTGVDVTGRAVVSVPCGLSADGTIALFSSAADHVVPGDDNGFTDLFVRTSIPESVRYFCTAKVNSLGCSPQIRAYGKSSATENAGFQIVATSVRNQRAGMLLHAFGGRVALPFAGGTLCLVSPRRSMPISSSGGSSLPANDCTGHYSLDVNTFAYGLGHGFPLPELVSPGTLVECQWWSRDPGFAPPDAIGLTGGLEYTVGP